VEISVQRLDKGVGGGRVCDFDTGREMSVYGRQKTLHNTNNVKRGHSVKFPASRHDSAVAWCRPSALPTPGSAAKSHEFFLSHMASSLLW